MDKIQQGIGDKLANFFQWGTCCIAGIAIGFAYGWKLTLVILAVGPALALCGALMGWVSYSKKYISDDSRKHLFNRQFYLWYLQKETRRIPGVI